MLRFLLVTSVFLAAAPAQASTLRFVLGSAPVEVSSTRLLQAERVEGGIIIHSLHLPKVYFAASAEPCVPSDDSLELEVPTGFYVRPGDESPAPWPGTKWATLCVEGDGLTVDVAIEHFELLEPHSVAHVRSLLATLLASLRPPIDLGPNLRLSRTTLGPLVRRGAQVGEVIYEGVVYALSVTAKTCPTELRDPRSACRELASRAAIVDVANAADAGAVDVDFMNRLLAIAELEHGRPQWLADLRGNFHPRWANGELPLSQLPPGRWKLASRANEFELVDIQHGAHLVVTRTSCRGAEGARAPDGAMRILQPRFLPAAEAWLVQRATWVATACFPLLGADVAVRLELPAAPEPDAEDAYVRALTEVLDAPRAVHTFGILGNSGLAGVTVDTWVAGKFSGFVQLEIASGFEGDDTSVRFDLAFGGGVSRPTRRAGIHLGVGLNVVPMYDTVGDDRSGGSVFVDGRYLGAHGPLVLYANARATLFYDLDCTETSDPERSCGDSDRSDFDPLLGGEAEVRIASRSKRGAWNVGAYVGLRAVGVTSGDRTETSIIGTLGTMLW